ncbi:arginine--tRNA ligase [Candidatus Micrarchaeota archaeon]|nr:arginine--tRNA ligase [Candidatus Micrarchaeota archaeon]
MALQKFLGECEKISGLKAQANAREGRGLASANCFELSREQKKDPREIAEIAAGKASKRKKTLVGGVAADNGYVNFFPSKKFFELALKQALRKKFGENAELIGQKIVVEYSSPNVGKPFHIGHIRSTILGDAIKRLLEASGAKVISFNYPGDSGTQVAKLVLALELKKATPKNERQLLKLYQWIHKQLEKERAQNGVLKLGEKVREVSDAIEAQDAKTLGTVEKIREISFRSFEKSYKKLGVKFDEVTGESKFFANAKQKALEAKALAPQFVQTDPKDGTLVLKLEEFSIPNNILLRSNGTTLYITRDVGLADYKWEKYAFDKSITVTASEQNTHFKQLFKLLELMKRPYALKLAHVGFGLITLESGKISSREGNLVYLDEVLKEASESALAQIGERGAGYSPAERKKISSIVGVGSTKFGFLRVSNEKNILFNPSKAVSFTGDTGAYLQYTAVRAKSLLEKSGVKKIKPSELKFIGEKGADNDRVNGGLNEEEKKLVEKISLFPSIVSQATRHYSPHIVCEYLLKLAAAFNEFYAKHSVLDADSEDKKKLRLALVAATANVIENGLKIIGVSVPKKM